MSMDMIERPRKPKLEDMESLDETFIEATSSHSVISDLDESTLSHIADSARGIVRNVTIYCMVGVWFLNLGLAVMNSNNVESIYACNTA